MTQIMAFWLTMVNYFYLKCHFMVNGLSAWKSVPMPPKILLVNYFSLNKYVYIVYIETQTILRKVVNNEKVVIRSLIIRHLQGYSLIQVVNHG